MAFVYPFEAVRPVRNKVCIVPIFPYESYSNHEINRIIKTNPYSFLNVIGSSYIRKLRKEKKYKAIRKQYEKFKRKGVLIQDYLPFLYVLRISDVLGNVFTGIVGLASLDEYAEGKILKHEQTISKRIKTFSEYLANTHIQAEPVMLTYQRQAALDQILRKYQGQVAEYDFSTTDGTVYEVWLISNYEDIKKVQNAFAQVDKLYIADGHHRAESTWLMQQKMKKNNPYHTGSEAYNFLLSFFIPFDQLKIYPFYRGMENLNGLDKDTFLKELKQKFTVKKIPHFREPQRHEFVWFSEGEFYLITIPQPFVKQYGNDAEILNQMIIREILKIEDPRNAKSIKYFSGKFGVKCVLKNIKEKKCKNVFFMHPLTFSEIKAVADAGQTLPPKSTYIDPKLLTGLFVYEF